MRAAFTLLEAMIAVAIFASVLSVISSTLGAGIRASDQVQRLGDMQSDATRIVSEIATGVRSGSLQTPDADQDEIGGNFLGFRGIAWDPYVDMAGATPTASGEVTYEMRTVDATNPDPCRRHVLVRTYPDPVSGIMVEEIVATGVAEFYAGNNFADLGFTVPATVPVDGFFCFRDGNTVALGLTLIALDPDGNVVHRNASTRFQVRYEPPSGP